MGLKTNSRKAIENIRKYIIDGFDGESHGWEDAKSFEDVSKCIMTVFYIERGKPLVEDRHYFRTYQDAFIDWCSGLPTIIDTCYYYNRSAIKDLGDILEENLEEREKYTEHEAEDLLSYLIFREVLKGCKHQYKMFRECN
ncbi:MAG: hypothetical protein IIY21_08675 [Clostridiales bacterium]|nr:hypothetical protein [Clostridiales bacterium]MBQ1573225.1 hypothetical protein [Clostridiales bacterium]